jgi:hypothetical protein
LLRFFERCSACLSRAIVPYLQKGKARDHTAIGI